MKSIKIASGEIPHHTLSTPFIFRIVCIFYWASHFFEVWCVCKIYPFNLVYLHPYRWYETCAFKFGFVPCHWTALLFSLPQILWENTTHNNSYSSNSSTYGLQGSSYPLRKNYSRVLTPGAFFVTYFLSAAFLSNILSLYTKPFTTTTINPSNLIHKLIP